MECSYCRCNKCDVCVRAAEEDLATQIPDNFFDLECWGDDSLTTHVDTSDDIPGAAKVDVRHAHHLVSEERYLGSNFLHYVLMYEQLCIVCFVAHGNKVTHCITACSTLFQKCLRCFRSHKVKDCGEGIRTINGTCPHCYLPDKIGNTVFHKDGFTVGCHGRNVLKFFALAALYFGAICETKWEWLYRRNQKGVLNLWDAFVSHCKAA